MGLVNAKHTLVLSFLPVSISSPLLVPPLQFPPFQLCMFSTPETIIVNQIGFRSPPLYVRLIIRSNRSYRLDKKLYISRITRENVNETVIRKIVRRIG